MKAMIYNHSEWVSETDPEMLKRKYLAILEDSGYNIIDMTEHYFKPHGYTLLVLLAESHLAIHTFPEERKTYLELSSCVKKQFIEYLEKAEQTNA